MFKVTVSQIYKSCNQRLCFTGMLKEQSYLPVVTMSTIITMTARMPTTFCQLTASVMSFVFQPIRFQMSHQF